MSERTPQQAHLMALIEQYANATVMPKGKTEDDYQVWENHAEGLYRQIETIVCVPQAENDLTEFKEGQWWISELDAIESTPFGEAVVVTNDMRRAVAVVHNLLRVVSKRTHVDVVWPEPNARIRKNGFSFNPAIEPTDYETEEPLYTRAQIEAMLAQQTGVTPDAQQERWMAVGKAIERACADQPDDTEIVISLERNAGTVVMFDPDGNEHDNFDHADGLDGVLNAAIDAAIAVQQKGQA